MRAGPMGASGRNGKLFAGRRSGWQQGVVDPDPPDWIQGWVPDRRHRRPLPRSPGNLLPHPTPRANPGLERAPRSWTAAAGVGKRHRLRRQRPGGRQLLDAPRYALRCRVESASHNSSTCRVRRDLASSDQEWMRRLDHEPQEPNNGLAPVAQQPRIALKGEGLLSAPASHRSNQPS